MWLQRLEARVADRVEHLLAGRADEDTLVELKSIWPEDHRNAARQIAGLANAARGEPIVWVIGVNERAKKLVHNDTIELSTWWAQVRRWFADDHAPEMQDITISMHGFALKVLYWTTNRAPYVVKTKDAGQVHREVPWREGNSTRSAHRHELLQSIIPAVETPTVEVVYAAIGLYEGRSEIRLRVDASVFFYATHPVMLPEHRWRYTLSVAGSELRFKASTLGPHRILPASNSGNRFRALWLGEPDREPLGNIAYVPGSGLQVLGSDRLGIKGDKACEGEVVIQRLMRARKAILDLRWPVAMSEHEALVRVPLLRVTKANLPVRSGPGPRSQVIFATESTPPSRIRMIA